MQSLSKEEKDLVLDFYFRCGDEETINQGRDLIASDPRAAQLYAQLEMSLKILDHANYEPCPDNLVEVTIARLKLAASATKAGLETATSGTGLERLLAAEQSKTDSVDGIIRPSRWSFWYDKANVGIVAAAILLVLAIAYPSLSNVRQQSWKRACASSLGRIGEGIANYGNDNAGALPSVAMTAGSPWWKVGSQKKQNESNTRHMWLLIQGGYVDGGDFVCAGRKDGKVIKFTPGQKANFHDFPSRNNITYSYMLMGPKRAKQSWRGNTVIMADRNPVFERLWQRRDGDEFKVISLSERLRQAMSSSHAMKGQMVLFHDGSVSFKKARVIDGDDIYTLDGYDSYSGIETPNDTNDVFLVP